MNQTNNTNFDYHEVDNEKDYENNRSIRKIEDGKYILLIYLFCLFIIFVHFLLFFHILFGFKTVKENIRKVLINNQVAPQDTGFSNLWTVEPIDG